MTNPLVLAGIAFFTAALFSSLELITTNFPRTSSFLTKDRALYIYAFLYGAFAFVVMLLLNQLIQNKSVTVTGPLNSYPWTRALVVGITIKALLHVNLFSITAGTKTTPIGLETIVQLFEPELLRSMTLNEFQAVRAYLKPRAAQHSDLVAIKALMKENVPPNFPNDERITFENALDKDDSVMKAMERFFRFVGRKGFDHIFPLTTA